MNQKNTMASQSLIVVILWLLMHILAQAGVKEFGRYDFVVIFEDYDSKNDTFKKKTILKEAIAVDTSQIIEPLMRGSAKRAEERGNPAQGYIFVATGGDPRIKYYVIHAKMAGQDGAKVFRFEDNWIKVNDLIEFFEKDQKKK